MTAINLAVQAKARAAYIISDCAVTAPDGTLIRSSSKVLHGLRFPWAFGMTGSVTPEAMFEEVAKAQPLNAKQLVKRLPDCMRRAVAGTIKARACAPAEVLLQVTGAMWDPKAKRIEGFFLTSHDGTLKGQEVEPYVWYETSWLAASGHPDGLRGYLGRDVDLTDPESFNPEIDGLALIEAQRRHGVESVQPGVEPGHCRIGAEAHLHVISRRGVTIYQLTEWPDLVGQRLTGPG